MLTALIVVMPLGILRCTRGLHQRQLRFQVYQVSRFLFRDVLLVSNIDPDIAEIPQTLPGPLWKDPLLSTGSGLGLRV